MAVHKCCTFRLKRKNLLSPTPDARCALLALRSIQLMTGEPRPRYNALQLLGVSGACGPNSHQLAGWDFFVAWLAAKPQGPMTIAWVNRSQHICNISAKFLNIYSTAGKATRYFGDISVPCGYNDIYRFKYHFPCIMYTIAWYNRP